jgi:hypothetical protein
MKIGNEKQAEKKEKIFKKEFDAEEKKDSDDSESLGDLESEKEISEEQIDVVDNKEKITLDDIIDKYEEAEKEKQTTEQKFEQKLKSTTEKQKEAIKEFEEIEKEKPTTNKFNDLLKTLNKLFSFIKNSVVARYKNHKQKKKADLENDVSIDQKTDDQKTENELLRKINLPSSRNKLILSAFVFIFLLFVGNLIFTGYKNEVERSFNFYSDILSQAEEKVSKAEEVMIYDDLAQARIFLMDAKNLTLEVKNNYNKLDTEAEGLLSRIQSQFDIVDLVNRIDNPEIAVDLNQTAEQIMLIGKKYYASDTNNFVYQIDLENKKAEDLQVKSDDIERSKLMIPIEKTGEIIFLSDSNKLSSLDLNKKELVLANIEFANDNPNIRDIASYNNYLYLLEPDANQIYKYRGTANGFDGGKSWITDSEVDIRNATSVAIDGFIYVLKSDGTIDKYLSGVKKDFSVEELSDPISSSAKIHTNANLEYLYVIDPPKQRVVLFNKINGSLIGQYTSSAFDNLKNVAVNIIEDKMYVLNGDKIFVVEIEGEE